MSSTNCSTVRPDPSATATYLLGGPLQSLGQLGEGAGGHGGYRPGHQLGVSDLFARHLLVLYLGGMFYLGGIFHPAAGLMTGERELLIRAVTGIGGRGGLDFLDRMIEARAFGLELDDLAALAHDPSQLQNVLLIVLRPSREVLRGILGPRLGNAKLVIGAVVMDLLVGDDPTNRGENLPKSLFLTSPHSSGKSNRDASCSP